MSYLVGVLVMRNLSFARTNVDFLSCAVEVKASCLTSGEVQNVLWWPKQLDRL